MSKWRPFPRSHTAPDAAAPWPEHNSTSNVVPLKPELYAAKPVQFTTAYPAAETTTGYPPPHG